VVVTTAVPVMLLLPLENIVIECLLSTVSTQRVGNSFRGWVETESELDYVLTCYKQATCTYWGTRQSPSPSQKTTRLMWKSQYVPFDGIPFINIGISPAIFICIV